MQARSLEINLIQPNDGGAEANAAAAPPAVCEALQVFPAILRDIPPCMIDFSIVESV
jgi:hypothetical protein